MIISSFYYSQPSDDSLKQIALSSNLNLIELEGYSSEIVNLYTAVLWAIEHDEDAILLIGNTFCPLNVDFKQIAQKVVELHSYEIYAFAITDEFLNENYVVLENGLFITDLWDKEDSWIVLKPLFSIIHHLYLEIISKYNKIKDVLNFFMATKFTFSPTKKEIYNEARLNLIVPFRNIEDYIGDCVKSINFQKYQNYRVFFIDDCSTDQSAIQIPISKNNHLLKNEKRKYALLNIVTALQTNKFNDHDIICLLDGDDRLSHPYVMTIVNQIYSASTCQLTYGSFRHIKGVNSIGNSYTEKEFKSIRKAPWKASHLKTFKFNLFKRLMELDKNLSTLRNKNGEFFNMPYDMAIMFPLMEIAGFEKSKFVNTPLYIYREHPGNDHQQNLKSQLEGENEIREKDNIFNVPPNN